MVSPLRTTASASNQITPLRTTLVSSNFLRTRRHTTHPLITDISLFSDWTLCLSSVLLFVSHHSPSHSRSVFCNYDAMLCHSFFTITPSHSLPSHSHFFTDLNKKDNHHKVPTLVISTILGWVGWVGLGRLGRYPFRPIFTFFTFFTRSLPWYFPQIRGWVGWVES